jgi:PAS domain S-box-containing protein
MIEKDKTEEKSLQELDNPRADLPEVGRLGAKCEELEAALTEADEMYRTLVRTSPDAITICDLDGKITAVSDRTIEIHGFENASELIGRSALDLAAPEERKRARKNLREAVKKGAVKNVKYNLLRKDGTRFIAELSASLIRNAHGTPRAFVGTTRDITAQSRTEMELRASEAKYRDLVQSANSVILRFDRAGLITYVNDFGLQFFGYKEEEILGRSIVGTIVPEIDSSGQNLATVMRDLLEDPEGYSNNENENVCRNGTRVWVAWSNKAVRNEQGDIVEVLAIGNDITSRRRAEEKLRESEERLRAQYQGTPVPTYTWQRVEDDFVLVDYNHAAETVTRGGVSRHLGITATTLYVDRRPDIIEDLERCFVEKTVVKREMPYQLHTTSEERRLDVSYAFVPPDLVLVHTEDITERKRLEDQLRWSQKMESVGRLAGGIAHDFNNILTTVIGHTELGMMGLHADDRLYDDLDEILKAAQRGAKLTQQFLTFSRRQRIEPKVVNLNQILADIHRMLQRIIGEDIELELALEEDLGLVKVDPGQIEQVIVNLSVNARDAMPEGGKLTIETSNIALDEEYARNHLTVDPGEYVMLAVSDTGLGMTEEVKRQLFEPFFTTKELGKGTGLGLATCYGIIKQSGGNIWVYSEPGQGSTFKIYLSRVSATPDVLPRRDESTDLPTGTETILLVEDEPSVRNIAARILREQGHRVIEASTGEHALEVFKEMGEEGIDLLLTDLVMPQMSGKELADQLKTTRPGLKVLFFSGYTDEVVIRHGLLDRNAAYLQKPFSSSGLTRKIRELLDS